MSDRSDKSDKYRIQTRLIHGKMHSAHWDYRDHIIPPISASCAYRLETAHRGAEGFREFANPEFNRRQAAPIYIYDRMDEPSRGMLEENLAAAEGGEACVTFAAGMAAISGALGVLLKTGDTLLAHKTLYGCTYSLFTNWYPRLGIKVRFLDMKDPGNLAADQQEDTNLMAVYGETPANPSLELLDLSAIAGTIRPFNERRGQGRRIYSVFDNTFATPFCQRPLEYGIDIVVHSLTKNIGGFGTDMGGAVICPEFLEPDLLLYRKDFGGVLSPRASWPPLVYGLPTLPLRARRQMETTMRVAKFLEGHPKVDRVVYPGLESHPQYEIALKQMRDFDGNFAPGIMVFFFLRGTPAEAKEKGARLMDTLAKEALTITLAVSLGQIRTLVEHPASMTHAAIPAEKQEEAGLDPGGIRLSFGLEEAEDLIRDLSEALEAV